MSQTTPEQHNSALINFSIGESGRTSGHLSNALDDGYSAIAAKHGMEGAKLAAESHTFALKHVGDLSKELGIDCEYRLLPGYRISIYPKSDPKHNEQVKELKDEVRIFRQLGMKADFKENYAVRGWDGTIDQRDAAIFYDQATFHPTKYLIGILDWLKSQPNFSCYTHTRMVSCEENGIEVLGLGSKSVEVKTLDGHTISCKDAVQATCIPLQKLAVVAQEEYYRTYCIAIRVPKGYIEDCLIYDQNDPYHYTRLTACDKNEDYLVVGGEDHKVGQESAEGRFEALEKWVRDRFTKAGSVDYKWSGQIFEPVDHMALIGPNQGNTHVYIATGDSGNGLTHGVIAGKLLSDQIFGIENKWSRLYDPKRIVSVAKSLPDMAMHDLQINAQYKRLLQSDLKDIEDLGRNDGGVINPITSKPLAIYKDENGVIHKFSALCPHMKGVVCWNQAEKSWDCPVHGSRFSKEGIQVIGPAKAGLVPVNEKGDALQQAAKA